MLQPQLHNFKPYLSMPCDYSRDGGSFVFIHDNPTEQIPSFLYLTLKEITISWWKRLSNSKKKHSSKLQNEEKTFIFCLFYFSSGHSFTRGCHILEQVPQGSPHREQDPIKSVSENVCGNWPIKSIMHCQNTCALTFKKSSLRRKNSK